MNNAEPRRWRPEELGESEAEEEEAGALVIEDEEEEEHHHHALPAFGEPGHYGPAAPEPPHPPAPPPPPRPPTIMTGFVRGKARYADEQDEEDGKQDNQAARRTRTTTAAAASNDECPSALYAALTARPAEMPEVTIVEDNEVEILPTRKRQRRQRRAQGAPALPNGAADGIILLDSDNDDIAGAQSAPTNAASTNADVILLLDDDEPSLPSFDCVICQERITSTDQATHERSTLHTFNAQKAVSTRRIMLPESNRGVQLLARLGWKEDKGLGKDGQGQIQPAKSTLKLDRTGLGHTQQLPARVTHVPSHNAEQAARAVDGKSEAQRKVEEMERRAREGRAAARGGGGKEGGGGEGSVTFGEVGRCETARERERRLRKEKETRARITAEFNWEEG